MPASRPDCVRGEGRQISIWPPSPVLRHDTAPASHRTQFPVNARGDMASAQPRAPVPPLPSVPLAGARRRSRMRGPGAVAGYSIPAMATPAPPRHRSSPRPRTPRTVTAPLFCTAVSATPFRVASNDSLSSRENLKQFSRTARLQEKEPLRGRTGTRRVSGRGRGVARVTSQARNAGMCLCAVLMYSSPAQRRIIRVRSPMAPQDTPGRGARPSRHRRPPLAPGGPEGVSKHPSLINGCGFADARRGLDTYPPLTRLRREYAPFRSDDRCVPAGPPMELIHPDCHQKGLLMTTTRR